MFLTLLRSWCTVCNAFISISLSALMSIGIWDPRKIGGKQQIHVMRTIFIHAIIECINHPFDNTFPLVFLSFTFCMGLWTGCIQNWLVYNCIAIFIATQYSMSWIKRFWIVYLYKLLTVLKLHKMSDDKYMDHILHQCSYTYPHMILQFRLQPIKRTQKVWDRNDCIFQLVALVYHLFEFCYSWIL